MADELKKKFQEMQEAKHRKKSDILVDEFEWIELNKQLSVDRQTGVKHQETPNEKLMRKFKENPLIPLGAALTTGFLVNGLIKFGRRDSAASQVMMRGRIAAQGFTICALMAGVMVEVRNKTWVRPTGPEEYKALTHQQNYSLPQGIPLLGSEITDSK